MAYIAADVRRPVKGVPEVSRGVSQIFWVAYDCDVGARGAPFRRSRAISSRANPACSRDGLPLFRAGDRKTVRMVWKMAPA